MTEMPIAEAHDLAVQVLRQHHQSEAYAHLTADHLIDAQLTGYTFAGLPRLLVVLDRLREQGDEQVPPPVEVTHETPVSATVHGHGNLGYVVCSLAVDKAIEKAEVSGVAVVGAYDSYYSGRSGYYAERAARAGFVAVHASSAFPMVAPTGGRRPLLGSNPIACAFPTVDDPLVIDLSTAASTWGALQLAQRTGDALPPDVAVDAAGQPTTDPTEALLGAILSFGGHKGYALGMAVQALGVLSGGDAVPDHFGNFGFFFLLVRRDLFIEATEYDRRVGELVDRVRSAPAADGVDAVRLPGDGAARRRRAALERGTVDIPDAVHRALLELVT